MKKILTLLLCTGAVVSTFAQTSSEESRRIILGRKSGGSTSGTGTRTSDPRDVILGRDDRRVDDNGSTRYPSGTYGSREEQINQVNREYDNKVYSIRNNPNLSEAEKERMIRQLNADRARRIKEINGRTQNRTDRDRRYDRDDRDDDDNYKKDKKYKSNNGNHYGWEKGKGNPHQNGGKPGKGNNGKGKGKN